jgi:hypothetical protein
LSVPIVRPVSWVVAATSLAVVILGARAVAGRRARLPEAPAIPGEEPARPAPIPRRAPTFRPTPPTPPVRAPTSATAHLRGRVITPPDLKDLEDLKVVADDGEHRYEAATNAAGEFQLHLPARGYTLTASLDGLVAVGAVRARAGNTEEVILTLKPGASIKGILRYRAPLREPLFAGALRSGTSLSIASENVEENGRFELRGLVPGNVYDLEIQRGSQKMIRRGVTAPAELELTLPELATLRGAIGFPAGTDCPFEGISLELRGGVEAFASVDRNCHFAFKDLTPASEGMLRASGGGWHFEEHVVLPAQGDPAPVCVNAPCRDLPPVRLADVEVILTGAPAESHVVVTASQGEGESRGCGSNSAQCEMKDLEAGVPVSLQVSANGCLPARQTFTPSAGKNTVNVVCRRMRVVEGVARGSDASDPASVRCQNGGVAVLEGSSIFEIHCPADQTELLYRKTARAPWRRTPLSPGTEPVFVELTL